jgi:hypothetical protein
MDLNYAKKEKCPNCDHYKLETHTYRFAKISALIVVVGIITIPIYIGWVLLAVGALIGVYSVISLPLNILESFDGGKSCSNCNYNEDFERSK